MPCRKHASPSVHAGPKTVGAVDSGCTSGEAAADVSMGEPSRTRAGRAAITATTNSQRSREVRRGSSSETMTLMKNSTMEISCALSGRSVGKGRV